MVDLGNLVNADLWVVINVPLDILHEGICNSEFWPIMFVKAATNLVGWYKALMTYTALKVIPNLREMFMGLSKASKTRKHFFT